MSSIVRYPATIASLLLSGQALAAQPAPFELEVFENQGARISWFGNSGRSYDLLLSDDLVNWGQADGYPRAGISGNMEQFLLPADHRFMRMASAADPAEFLLPEVAAYRSTTGISLDAANEINHFLHSLRGAGVEPALFWVGGSRYNSINGNTVRAVIGGTGTVIGSLGVRGERYETFSLNRALRFPNPLKQGSQSRVGFFAGAAPALVTGSGGLISGGETNPRGPLLTASWGNSNFQVFNAAGEVLPHSGGGGFVTADSFTAYVGGVYDGSYSVLSGFGKTAGTRETPLRYVGLPASTFNNNQFVNYQDSIDLGSPYFTGKLYFAVVTAADLTDNRRAYDLISIPRRSGFGSYGIRTAIAFLGDSIILRANEHIWNSDGQSPAHKGGGQWNRNALGMTVNATGEGNEAQIEYFEKAAKYALDTRTWDHLFFICCSGGHYLNADHVTQNPLSQQAKDAVDTWIRDYHDHIAIPAAELGATVVQMTYIYGCPQNDKPPLNSEVYRAMMDYFTAKQREIAQASGFPIVDVYAIPQLHAPLPTFYDDAIHPNPAGCRLIAQEFAATVANPDSRAPRSLSRPMISGSPLPGATLSVSSGTWAFSPYLFSYQWMREATDISGATNTSYSIQNADTGFHLSCRITATNGSGSAERTSAHSIKVP